MRPVTNLVPIEDAEERLEIARKIETKMRIKDPSLVLHSS